MELYLSSLMFYTVLLFLGYYGAKVLLFVVDFNRKCRILKKIPQFPSHWFHGHTREMFAESSKSFLEFSTRVMEEKDTKLFMVWNGMFPHVQICHPDTFKEVNQKVVTKDNSLTGAHHLMQDFIGQGLLGSNGSKWERNRKLLTPAFHFQILTGYVSVMNRVVEKLTEKLIIATDGGKSVDVYPYVCRSALDALVACSLSHDGNFQDHGNSEYITSIKRILELETARYSKPWQLFDCLFHLSPSGRELKRLCSITRGFTGNIIKARQEELKHNQPLKEKRRLDFLDILLTARDENGEGLTYEEIQDEVDTFTFAGHDTTASAISWTLYALGLHHDYQELVYQDVCKVLADDTDVNAEHLGQFTYLTQFIKETLRFYTPVPVITRRTEDPVELDGYLIPAGMGININLYAIHHNKKVWKDPDEFRPERFDPDHRDENEVFGLIPFSAGSRNCIGQVFAMNEVKITIAKLVKRFKIIKDPDHVTDIRPEFVMVPSNEIKLFLKDRKQL